MRKQQALEALGAYCKTKSEADLEYVREMVRRLLWMANEESGNSMKNAPEAITEILLQVPQLAEEFSPILASLLKEK